jgi:hypothetical protein
MSDSAEAKRSWGSRLAATISGWVIAVFNVVLGGEFSPPPPIDDKPVSIKTVVFQLAVTITVAVLLWRFFQK